MRMIKRWWKRALFRWGSRVVKRDAEGRFIFPMHRLITRTPMVRGKRLALKQPFPDKERVRKAVEAVRDYHQSITPSHYTLVETKRYPSISGMRTEEYYDRPSLKDLINGKKNRRVRAFLRKNSISFNELITRADEVYEEIELNFFRAQMLRVGVEIDVNPDQFLVDRIESNGKWRVIMVDI